MSFNITKCCSTKFKDEENTICSKCDQKAEKLLNHYGEPVGIIESSKDEDI